ncbi:adenine phosphoribosyltransferase [bacterium]|nr:adenine phosphoribosyltransferase [bacterium]
MTRSIDLSAHIRDVPDFPVEGILFKDITPLLGHPAAFATAVDRLAEAVKEVRPELVVAMEARGFIFAAPLAYKLGLPFVPVRKPGKLPAETVSISYELEYGTDTLEMHKDAIPAGARVLVVDDLLATGGTAHGVVELVRKVGGDVVGLAFVIELASLEGRKKFADLPLFSLIRY